MILDLGRNLEWIELNGMPAFTEGASCELTHGIPRQFAGGTDVLVYAQRHNERFMFLGRLVNAKVDEEASLLRFDRFERFARPVLMADEGIDKPELYEPLSGFAGQFCYITKAAFDLVIAESGKPAPA